MIYTSISTYVVLFCVDVFILCFAFGDVNNYYLIYKSDIFLWLIAILSCITIHKRFVYSIWYSIIVRIGKKSKNVIANCVILLISTIIICLVIYCIPCMVLCILNQRILFKEEIIFYFIRYVLVAFLVQYIIFVIMLMTPKIQRNNNIIYLMPFFMFFIITLPKEFIYTYFQKLVPALDFGSGGKILITKQNLLMCIFFNNIHLVGYSVCFILLSINFLVYYMELLENEED